MTPLRQLVDRLRGLVADPGDGSSDAQLLARFARHQDEAAFAELVRRHGPLVQGVCRRLLGHEHDSEDAFQATFFILARRAASSGWDPCVAGWLHGVARRVCLKLQTSAGRRVRRQQQAARPEAAPPSEEAALLDVRPILDEEIARLPARYRQPIVLCYLEGKSNEEAARLLGMPVGTLWSCLSRGREQLKRALSRRGIALSAAAWAALTAPEALAHHPETIARAALAFVRGVPPDAAALPAHHLARGVLRTMNATRWKLAGLLLIVLGSAAGALAYSHGLPAERGQAAAVNALVPDLPEVKKPEKPEIGTSIPANAPVQARLVARKTEYVLDLGGLTQAQYAEKIKASAQAAAAGNKEPEPAPAVDFVLEIVNVSDKPVELWTNGDQVGVRLELAGPGVVALQIPREFTRELRLPTQKIKLEPGKSYDLPITDLAQRFRGQVVGVSHWTQPGEVTLKAIFNSGVTPSPKDSLPFMTIQDRNQIGHGSAGAVMLTSNAVTLKVR